MYAKSMTFHHEATILRRYVKHNSNITATYTIQNHTFDI